MAVLGKYFENIPDIIEKRRIITPADLETTYGATHGSPTHGDLTFARLWNAGNPVPWSGYHTEISGLYLCGSGTWPGGAVTGASGYNAAHVVLEDVGSFW